MYFHFPLKFLVLPKFSISSCKWISTPDVYLTLLCLYILPSTTHRFWDWPYTFLVILTPFHWLAYSYCPSSPLSPTQHSELLLNMKVKNQEVEMHNALSSLTVWELKLRSEWGEKMDITFFLQSQEVRDDDGWSSWREVIMFSTWCIASAQLFL